MDEHEFTDTSGRRSTTSRPSSRGRCRTSRSSSRTRTRKTLTSSAGTTDWARHGPGRRAPDRIVIYRLPLVESFHDPEELRREIRITVLHEVGHYFGLDEKQIEELGYG